jgi:hypothetical protein
VIAAAFDKAELRRWAVSLLVGSSNGPFWARTPLLHNHIRITAKCGHQ